MSDTPRIERIELRVPARAEYVGVVRLTSAGIAGRLNLSYDDIEDLKIAVAEAATHAMLQRPRAQELLVQYLVGDDRLEVVVSEHGDGGAPAGRGRTATTPEADRALGLFLIKCLMDEAEEQTEPGGRAQVRMVKFLHRGE